MTANINESTGVPYGFISANSLDHDVVEQLMYGSGSKNLTYQHLIMELARDHGYKGDDYEEAVAHCEETCFGALEDMDDGGEPVIEGTYEGVSYLSSWLGGALHFFILHSPHLTEKARNSSPCVPNVGILDTLDGDSVSVYNVPDDWRM